MYLANKEKRKIVNDEPKQEKIRKLGENETYKYVGILKRIPSNKLRWKKKILKRVTLKNQKTARN